MSATIQQWGSSIIYALLFFMPLIFLPPSVLIKNSLDVPRRLLILLGTGLLLALIVKGWSERHRLVIRWHPLDFPVLLFFLGAVISSLGGVFPLISFCGPVWGEDSLTLLWMSVIIYFSVKEFLRTPKQLEYAVFLLVLCGGCSALLGFLDWLHLLPISFNPTFTGHDYILLDARQRLVATMGNSMFTGTFFAILIPLAYGAAVVTTDRAKRTVLLSCLILMLPALLLTMARAAWVGLAVTVIVMTVLCVTTMQANVKKAIPFAMLIVTVSLVLLAVLIAINVPSLRDRLCSVVQMEGQTIQTRKIYMHTAVNEFLNHPIQGVGFGNFQYVFQQYRPSSSAIEQGIPLNRGFNSSLPHNLLLQIAAECGLIGLLPFLFILFRLYRSGAQLLRGSVKEAWLGAGLLGLCSCALITNMSAFDNFATTMLFWAAMGLLASIRAEERTLPERYGILSRPISHNLTFALNVASLVIALGITLNFLTQTFTAYSLQQGLLLVSRVQEHRESDPVAAIEKGVRAIRAANAISFMNPDFSGYQALFLANHSLVTQLVDQFQALKSSDPQAARQAYEQAEQASRDMRDAGHQSLQLMDRDPMTMRLMVMDLTQSRNKNDIQEARKLADSLLKHEPMSAEAHVMSADLYEREGELPENNSLRETYLRQAIEDATQGTTLDPTFKEAWVRLAHLNVVLGISFGGRLGAEALTHLEDACTQYKQAQALGIVLNPDDALDNTVALLQVGRISDAIAVGRTLRHAPGQFNKLCRFINDTFNTPARKADGARIIQQLQALP